MRRLHGFQRFHRPENGIHAFYNIDPVLITKNGMKQIKGVHYIEETYKNKTLICAQGWLSPTENIYI